MIIFKHSVLLYFMYAVRTNADGVMSDEVKSGPAEVRDRYTHNVLGAERRFIDNLNDDDWHVSHLKDTDFAPSKKGCKEETFDEKVKRYRKSLLKDGSLVDYVSADALPSKPKDLAPDVCRMPEAVERILKPAEQPHGEVKSNNNKPETNVTDEVNTATTHSDKPKVEDAAKDGNRRNNEYMFSSDEYEEEAVDFDVSVCPADVIEVILEEDHIRNYDVQCQLMLQWRTLE